MLKELPCAENKRPQLETRELRMAKFTSKGKHTVKVGNHPHTTMISKPATVRRVQIKDIEITSKIKSPAN